MVIIRVVLDSREFWTRVTFFAFQMSHIHRLVDHVNAQAGFRLQASSGFGGRDVGHAGGKVRDVYGGPACANCILWTIIVIVS